MKNKFYLILFSIFLAFEVNSYSEEFKITSSSIKADKNSGNVILEEKVKIIDEKTFWVTSEDEGIVSPFMYKIEVK